MTDYDRIASAIDFIVENADQQPELADVARHARLSPYHFQRVFRRWAGVSPKRFLQVITVERAKLLLARGRTSLLDASEALGLSSSSRLHEHFVSLEAMTPDQYRQHGAGLTIRYGESDSLFGQVFVATTGRGVCALSFLDHDTVDAALARLVRRWPGAGLVPDPDQARVLARQSFAAGTQDAPEPLSLAVIGTNLQVAVWRALLRIPPAAFVSYGDLARAVGRPTAVRAVASAVGANPCAFVIPCHRVIRGSGAIGGYRWGLTRKHAMNAWEAANAEGMLTGC
jgi:AraC family transcriptional regulator of adaptative response/methylated-DNA-[protein]-cysteine methyltransferase